MTATTATVTVLDETGKTLATGKPVTATGGYGPIPLTGAGPFRVRACGLVADRALCVWGATTTGGVLNLTPLSSAVTVLASGQSPETLMSGAVQGLTDAALATAQAQLRTALASSLTDAGLASDFDLLTGALTPGSHTGYDRVLDTVAVGLGLDAKPYVTLSSALGSGWVYLEPGTSAGSLSLDAGASRIDHAGIDALYKSLGTVMPVAKTCPTGLPALLDPLVRASADFLVPAFNNVAQASQVLCGHMGGLLVGDTETLESATLLPAVPSRCDFTGADPVCRVKLVFKTAAPPANAPVPTTPKDVMRQIGIDQTVVKRTNGWLLLGNRLEVQATATARLVLSRRVDQTAADVYSRYVDLRIPAYPGLQCARASQKDGSGADVALALFKPAAGTYLSLWATSASNATPSLDPLSGATQGADAVSLAVPGNAAGDTTARNFARAGRALKVELFADAACSTPLAGADGGAVSIDVAGQLPLNFVGQSGQPWPTVVAASTASLVSLKGAVNAKITFGPTWTPLTPGLAVTRAQLCTDAACSAPLSTTDLPSAATGAALNATLGVQALNASAYKLLRVTGRTADGLVLQLDSASCTAQASGQPC
ncbi:MAG: hypothetical protein HY020_09595 [Burkholderiales bacterium]|nr:hypothetical protein [Burkholderiales bacterium]